MLCDDRLRTRPYGRIFLDSLPLMPRTEELEEVQQFLREQLAAVGITPDAKVMTLDDGSNDW
jgi:ATP-dependent DNA helicase DinG